MRAGDELLARRRYPLLLLVLWALGLSMIVLAALVHLPRRVLAIGSLAVIASAQLLDGVPAATFRCWLPGVWNMLHQQGVFILGGIPVRSSAYPLDAVGGRDGARFRARPVFLLPPEDRRRVFLKWGRLSSRASSCCARSTSTAIRRRGRAVVRASLR